MTSLIHKDLSAVSGDLVEGSNDYLIIRRLKQYNTTINLDSHPWENRSGSFKSCINPWSAGVLDLTSCVFYTASFPLSQTPLCSVTSCSHIQTYASFASSLLGRCTDRLPAMSFWHAATTWILCFSLAHSPHSFNLSPLHSQASLVGNH